MKTTIIFLSIFLICSALAASVSACPACAESLSSDPVNAGISRGIGLTIFFFLGVFGSVVGVIIWVMVKEGRKSQLRHDQMAAQQTSATL